MKKTLALITLIGAFAAPVGASGYHGRTQMHDVPVLHADAMAIGYPGDPVLIERTIRVSMRDLADPAMAFDPETVGIEVGETVRIVLTNEGSMAHEFVMATPDEIDAHRRAMRDDPAMPHDEAYAARVKPSQSGSLIWTFATAGEFAFACLIPGHAAAGMRGRLTVG